jgi:hypothetical protein
LKTHELDAVHREDSAANTSTGEQIKHQTPELAEQGVLLSCGATALLSTARCCCHITVTI